MKFILKVIIGVIVGFITLGVCILLCLLPQIKKGYEDQKTTQDNLKILIQKSEDVVKDAKKTVEDSAVNRQSQYKKDRENLIK